MGRLIRSLCLYARLFCERLQYEIFCNLLNKTYLSPAPWGYSVTIFE